jgi:hypothetical protein
MADSFIGGGNQSTRRKPPTDSDFIESFIFIATEVMKKK